MNLLLTSVGRRSYLVNYFKQAVGNNGEIHVSNSSAITPTFSFADKSVVTPLIYDETYVSFLLDYCVNNKITAIISLFDVDLPVLSANIKAFNDIGTTVIISNKKVIDVCNDKWKTYIFLKKYKFNVPKTYISIENVIQDIATGQTNYPMILKPRWGMGSIGIFEAENEMELKIFYNKILSKVKNSYLKYESEENINQSILIQEKINGQEYGLDIINDLNGKYQNTIVKKKIAMRSGETDCAETVNNITLKKLGEQVSMELGHIANLDVDVFMVDEKPYVLEMNARFGGGYPFSHVAGVDLPLAIIKWLRKENVDTDLLQEKSGILTHKDIEIVNITHMKNNHSLVQ